ncbi:MAG: hypothetical protein P8X79_13235 [Reinekea sp.]
MGSSIAAWFTTCISDVDEGISGCCHGNPGIPKNWGEPMGAPAIFEKQIEIKLLHPASTLESRTQV